MNTDYNMLIKTFNLALKRASEGKGKERHATNEPFEKQELCRALREFGITPAVYQIRKKAQECVRLDDLKASEELLDIMVYAAAAYITLYEKLPNKSIEPDYDVWAANDSKYPKASKEQASDLSKQVEPKTKDVLRLEEEKPPCTFTPYKGV